MLATYSLALLIGVFGDLRQWGADNLQPLTLARVGQPNEIRAELKFLHQVDAARSNSGRFCGIRPGRPNSLSETRTRGHILHGQCLGAFPRAPPFRLPGPYQNVRVGNSTFGRYELSERDRRQTPGARIFRVPRRDIAPSQAPISAISKKMKSYHLSPRYPLRMQDRGRIRPHQRSACRGEVRTLP